MTSLSRSPGLNSREPGPSPMSRRVEERYEADSEPEPRRSGPRAAAWRALASRGTVSSCLLASAPFVATRSKCWGFDGLPRRIGLDYPENGDDAVGRTLEDIGELARERWFSDCAHASESGCAVKQAIDVGELNLERLERYHALTQESECPACFRAASREGKRPMKRWGPVCFVLSLEKTR